ncbi:MAG: hypothetical protein R3E79_37280 [Caldilineaceae bacterium]
MSKIAAILPNEEVAEAATDHLAQLKIDDLTWELLREEDNTQRVLPAFVWPAGSTGTGGGVGAPIGLPARTNYPEDRVIEDEGAEGDVADFYAQSIAHGATVIIVDAPHSYRDRIHETLESAGATNVSWE